jgi:hypothetical protein
LSSESRAALASLPLRSAATSCSIESSPRMNARQHVELGVLVELRENRVALLELAEAVGPARAADPPDVGELAIEAEVAALLSTGALGRHWPSSTVTSSPVGF